MCVVAHKLIGKHQRHHCLGDRHAADPNAWIMPALCHQFDFIAVFVNRLALCQDR